MKTTTPKHRAIIHLAADMRKGAGAHPMTQKSGPTVDEWDEQDLIAHVELDWCSEEDAYARQHAANYGVIATVVKLVGPGGGWPLIRFSGPLALIAQLEANYWDSEFNDTEIVL